MTRDLTVAPVRRYRASRWRRTTTRNLSAALVIADIDHEQSWQDVATAPADILDCSYLHAADTCRYNPGSGRGGLLNARNHTHLEPSWSTHDHSYKAHHRRPPEGQ